MSKNLGFGRKRTFIVDPDFRNGQLPLEVADVEAGLVQPRRRPQQRLAAFRRVRNLEHAAVEVVVELVRVLLLFRI